jgi:pilus assembly protein CpaB
MKFARVAVLGVALAAGGGAAWLASGTTAPEPTASAPPPAQLATDEVLVASKDLPLGSLLVETDLAWQAWPKDAVSKGMIRKSDGGNAIEDAKGSVSRGNFFEGEPIRREKLVKGPNSGFLSAILPTGFRAVAINIDAQGGTTAGGFILPNDRIDVIRTFRDQDQSKITGTDVYTSETILSNVRVLAIGQNVQEKNGERVITGSNATLELDPKQAETVVLAQRIGQLSLSLRSMVDASKVKEDFSHDDHDAITVVRYGVAARAATR